MVLIAPFPPAIFVGRAPELDRLGELLSRVPVAVVVGVPGVGKSALACAAAARWPAPTAQRAVRPGESLATVADDLRRTVARRRVREPIDDEDRLADLAHRLDEAGALVVLDDLHALAADEQRLLIDVLAARLRSGRLVATARERVPATTRADYGVVQVPPLDLADGRELWHRLDELYGPSAGFDAAWTRAAGSPLLLRQAHAAEPLGDDPADSVVAALDDDERTLAAALALGDVPLPLALLSRLVPAGGRAPLRRLVRRLVVEVDGADVARIHDLFRAAVLARLSDDEARALRRRLAALLPSSAVDPVARIREAARHLCAAGDGAAAARLLLDHAADLIRVGAAGELRRALLRVPPANRSADVDVALARALIRQLDLPAAFDALARLAAAERPPRPELGLSFGLVAMLTTHLDEAEAVLRSVVDHADATATQRLRARINLAVILTYRGDAAGADALLAAAADDAGDDVQRGTVALGRVLILWLAERDPAAMLATVERARTLLDACATFRGTVLAPALAAAACARNGRFADADALLARTDAAQTEQEDARMQLTARFVRASCDYERGRHALALDQLRAARAAFDRAGDRLGVLFADSWIGRALLSLGHRAEGLATLAAAEETARARGVTLIADLCARAASVILDASAHTLSAAGTVVALARRPAQRRLLYRLARDAGAVVDKEALAAAIWPGVAYHPLVHDGVLKVHIRNLRLALDGTPLAIDSGDDGGYRLAAPPGFVFIE